MVAMAVDRMVAGGWLEFLCHVEYEASKSFSQEVENAQCNEQAATLRNQALVADSNDLDEFESDDNTAAQSSKVNQDQILVTKLHDAILEEQESDASIQEQPAQAAIIPLNIVKPALTRPCQLIWDNREVQPHSPCTPVFMPITAAPDGETDNLSELHAVPALGAEELHAVPALGAEAISQILALKQEAPRLVSTDSLSMPAQAAIKEHIAHLHDKWLRG